MSLDLLKDAMADYESLQNNVLDIQHAMDRSISSMDKFKESFAKYLRVELGYAKELFAYGLGSQDSYYRLDAMHSKNERIWIMLAQYEKHMSKMGYIGFSKELKLEMSRLAEIMNRIREYKDKLKAW